MCENERNPKTLCPLSDRKSRAQPLKHIHGSFRPISIFGEALCGQLLDLEFEFYRLCLTFCALSENQIRNFMRVPLFKIFAD